MVALSPKFIALGLVLFGSAFSGVLADQAAEETELVARELEAFGASISARHAMGVFEAREPTPEEPSSLSHTIAFREVEDNEFDAREVEEDSDLVARTDEPSIDISTISFREVDEDLHELSARGEPSSLEHLISFRELESGDLVERSDEDLEVREEEFEERSVEDNIYEIGDVAHLNSRSVEEGEDLAVRSVEDNIYDIGDVAHLNSRSIEDEEDLFAREEEEADLVAREFHEEELEERELEEDDLVTRELEEDELVARELEEDDLATRELEEDDLVTREEDDLVTRELEENDLVTRESNEDVELFTRSVEDNIYEIGDVAHLNSRTFEDEQDLFARELTGNEVDLD